ncbi:MAG: uroporphyrinogen-III synthase [Hyphomicrobiales bacterium]|nr:uroporphyrinogen-III synthase [Hyphomicrobiales bacterium]
MRLLITRAADEAAGFEAKLKAPGYEVIIAPLLDIKLLPLPPVADADAIIITSKNALRAIERSGWLKQAQHLPLFCPGPGTAELALSLGFTDIREAAGDAAGIPALVEAGRREFVINSIAYYCADETAFDMDAAVSALGIRLRKQIAYHVKPAPCLPANAVAEISASALDGVILLSPRTAAIYRLLVMQAGLEVQAARIPAYCISSNVAAKLDGLSPTHVAAAPTIGALLALLQK